MKPINSVINLIRQYIYFKSFGYTKQEFIPDLNNISTQHVLKYLKDNNNIQLIPIKIDESKITDICLKFLDSLDIEIDTISKVLYRNLSKILFECGNPGSILSIYNLYDSDINKFQVNITELLKTSKESIDNNLCQNYLSNRLTELVTGIFPSQGIKPFNYYLWLDNFYQILTAIHENDIRIIKKLGLKGISDKIKLSKLKNSPIDKSDTIDIKVMDISDPYVEYPELEEMFTKYANTTMPILILGETGVGKTAFAKRIHAKSYRRNNRFVNVNCSTLIGEMAVSELLGHEQGSFTGANTKQVGYFQQADKGTIFLDEIGDVSEKTQVMLLKVIDEKKFIPRGGNEEIKSDFRLISGTNQNLEDKINEKTFRRDLYSRINGIPITIPPVREKMVYFDTFLTNFVNYICKIQNRNVFKISKNALDILKNYSWPENIRQLYNVLEYAILKSENSVITSNDFPPHILDNKQADSKLNKLPDECCNILNELSPLFESRTFFMERIPKFEEYIKCIYSKNPLENSSLLKYLRSKVIAKSLDVDRVQIQRLVEKSDILIYAVIQKQKYIIPDDPTHPDTIICLNNLVEE